MTGFPAARTVSRPVLVVSLVGGTLFQVPLTLFTSLSGGPYGAPFTVGESPGLVFSASAASFNPLIFFMNVLAIAIPLVAVSLGRHLWIAISGVAGGLLFQLFALMDYSRGLRASDLELWLPVPVPIATRPGSSGIEGWPLLIDGLIGVVLLAAAAHVLQLVLRRGGPSQTPHAENDAVVGSHTAGGASSGS